MDTAPCLVHRIDALLRRNVFLHTLIGNIKKRLTRCHRIQRALRRFLIPLRTIKFAFGFLSIHTGRLKLVFRIGNSSTQGLSLRNGIVTERILKILVNGNSGLVALLNKAARLMQYPNAGAQALVLLIGPIAAHPKCAKAGNGHYGNAEAAIPLTALLAAGNLFLGIGPEKRLALRSLGLSGNRLLGMGASGLFLARRGLAWLCRLFGTFLGALSLLLF